MENVSERLYSLVFAGFTGSHQHTSTSTPLCASFWESHCKSYSHESLRESLARESPIVTMAHKFTRPNVRRLHKQTKFQTLKFKFRQNLTFHWPKGPPNWGVDRRSTKFAVQTIELIQHWRWPTKTVDYNEFLTLDRQFKRAPAQPTVWRAQKKWQNEEIKKAKTCFILSFPFERGTCSL